MILYNHPHTHQLWMRTQVYSNYTCYFSITGKKKIHFYHLHFSIFVQRADALHC